MTSTALRPLSTAPAISAAGEGEWRRPDAVGLDSDRIDFDAWLLPPVAQEGHERLVRLLSQAAGPAAFFLAVAAGLVTLL